MALYSRFVRRCAGARWFVFVARRVGPGADRMIYRASRGRRMATPSDVPTLFLTTTGRHSGGEHTVPVTFLTRDGFDHVVGTNFGRMEQPAWALNLLSHPEGVAEYRGRRWSVRATPLGSREMDALWPLFDALVPAYRLYRERADRPIHMFRLEQVE